MLKYHFLYYTYIISTCRCKHRYTKEDSCLQGGKFYRDVITKKKKSHEQTVIVLTILWEPQREECKICIACGLLGWSIFWGKTLGIILPSSENAGSTWRRQRLWCNKGSPIITGHFTEGILKEGGVNPAFLKSNQPPFPFWSRADSRAAGYKSGLCSSKNLLEKVSTKN